jgi:hypothetical protein
MRIYNLDPLQDSRWDALVASHPRSAAFHHKGWLGALAQTYRYRPIAFTSTSPGERLTNAIVFCEVKSWITGDRLVSLPFADHADPLLNESVDFFELKEWMQSQYREHSWKYIEIRPTICEMESCCSLIAGRSFWLHTLNLTPSLEQIYCGFHKNCIQRRIQRAERENLSYEKGCSKALLDDFYGLQMRTRRRHHLLPQPLVWFYNLAAYMSPNVDIRLARKDGVPIAAILTLRHRGTVVFKYGCSDERFHHLGGMPFVFWKLIEESKSAGAEQIDLGRTDKDNKGLLDFKDRLGATRKPLTYFRYPVTALESDMVASCLPATRGIFSLLPDALSSRMGRLLYRHIG